MAFDRTRTARGALAGTVAAAVWSAQQPLDMRLFGVRYDDTELLGKAVTRGRWWRVAGNAIHLANGAAFGAAYAALAPRVPLPGWAKGPAAAVAENTVLWPATALVDRFHPAREDLPGLSGNLAAFAQATWRHLLFGVVLGELERVLNQPQDEEVPSFEHVVSSNGHGSLAHAASAGPSGS
jgi:hypothetical protein